MNSFSADKENAVGTIRIYEQDSIDGFSGTQRGIFSFKGKDGTDWRKQTLALEKGKYFIGFEAMIYLSEKSDMAIDKIRLEHQSQCHGK